jgi:hypothetical protein
VGADGVSEASKKGLSGGWLDGEAFMGERTVGERSLRRSGEVGGPPSASGEDTLGVCLLDEELPSREIGKRPLFLPPATTICCALP